ncbi:MAG: FAD-dependent oxidoreductase [Bacteroidales bacterium]|nr:FAD-dependent oxidoreductase [Bacteroidales bacterium]
MLAKKYLSEVVSIANPFKGIYTVEFKSLERPYKYAPGQFLHIAIDEEYDGIGQWPESRCFSMQSDPAEDVIRITYAVKGNFTQEMEKTLAVGREVWLKLPFGELFTQPHNKTNTVFIAGGTGVTPFLSLFTHESFRDYADPKIYLGYKNEDYYIYQKEFAAIKNDNAQITIFFENKDGVIDIAEIHEQNGNDSSYFISGPPVMIKIFKEKLIELGVPKEHVLTDDWE